MAKKRARADMKDASNLTGSEFLSSKWMEEAKDPAVEKTLPDKFTRWKSRVSDAGILQKAGSLWGYLTSGKVSAVDKTILIAGLLYLISPLDFIPDAIPIVGWLDDLGVAAFVLSHVTRRLADAGKAAEEDLDAPLYSTPEALERGAKESPLYRGGIAFQLEELRAAAEEIGAASCAEMADELAAAMDSQYFRVMFVGRFNSGKSSLINAFLHGVTLPVGPVPTTKALIHILRGQKAELYSMQPDGEIVVHASPGDLGGAADPKINSALAFSLFLPIDSFPGEMTFIDTPGLLDTRPEISALTLAEVPRADALVVVLDALAPLSREEMDFIISLPDKGRTRKVFFVLNKMDRVDLGEREDVIRAMKSELSAAGIADMQLFGLSAQAACQALAEGKSDPGFEAFRSALSDFLHSGAQTQLRKERQRQVDELRRRTAGTCDGIVHLAEMTVQDRIAEVKLREAERLRAREEFLRRQKTLENEAALLSTMARANLEDFTQTLAAGLHETIQAAKKAEDLPTAQALSRRMKEDFQQFIDAEILRIEKAWTVKAAAVRAELLSAVQGANVGVSTDGGTSFIADHPGLILLGGVALAWPITGLVTFTALTIGTLVGQNYLSGLIRDAANLLVVQKTRTELLTGLDARLEEIRKDLSGRFDAAINSLCDQTLSRLRSEMDVRLKPMELPLGETEGNALAETARRVGERLRLRD